MSQLLIQKYLNELAKLRRVSGTHRESVVREAFKDLLKTYGRSRDLTFVAEYQCDTKTKERRYVDGALLHTLRVPFGYWEAKDTKDDLDTEIDKKFRAGYPKTNIIFEDSSEAVLIQHGEEVMRCGVEDVEGLEQLLDLFFSYERPEVEAFRKAVQQFKTDLPVVLESLRAMIERAYKAEPQFRVASEDFLTHARGAINPTLTAADVREMLIQHVLTGEVFAAVFPGTTYHEDNNVAAELHKLEATFFTGDTKFQALKGLDPYYAAIRKAGSQISTHHEKQTFLKAIYENFYKVYNRKAADRLGVVYTPNEIVRFMIESADWLCEKHFGRNLIDNGVDILDPATGTGTFICELIDHFSGQPLKLSHKYRTELHANEVAILPYYVANLNIEATYAAAIGRYEEFPGLCFVDTLDNTFALQQHQGHQGELFGALSDDNVKRIRTQNSRRISVIIGNPPYNANQLNENENNKNREYPEIDKRLKETYIKASTAQKTKLYDPYARFVRWASDRLDPNGIIAFISNNSFIDSRTFDGFRACLATEFNEVRVIDLKGNARTSGDRRRREGGNVFDNQIRVGVAVWFCVRKKGLKGCRVYYDAVGDYTKAEEKRAFLAAASIGERTFRVIEPDAKHNWINLADTDFESLTPVCSKGTKAAKATSQDRAIVRLFSLGVVTNRDEWMYAQSTEDLKRKVTFLIDAYNDAVVAVKNAPKAADIAGLLGTEIKWTRAVKRDVQKEIRYTFNPGLIVPCMYRPYVKRQLYYSSQLNEMQYLQQQIFPVGRENVAITVSGAPAAKPFQTLAVNMVPCLDLLEKTQSLPRFRYVNGRPVENITDWALDQFVNHYGSETRRAGRGITKEGIFHYVYAVLHDPGYRAKYAEDIRREFPRIPFYPEFQLWADWGRALVGLHVGYETAARFPLTRTDAPDEKAAKAKLAPRVMLQADRERGRIALDSETTLSGIPIEAWNYVLGNRSAIEWILDQSKEKTPKDPTIREKFNSYRFAEHKERVIDLLARVVTVSVETMRIVGAMRQSHVLAAGQMKSRFGPRKPRNRGGH